MFLILAVFNENAFGSILAAGIGRCFCKEHLQGIGRLAQTGLRLRDFSVHVIQLVWTNDRLDKRIGIRRDPHPMAKRLPFIRAVQPGSFQAGDHPVRKRRIFYH